MISQQTKEKASKLYDEGKWLQLAMLIVDFGIQLIKYLQQRKKSKDEHDTIPPTANDQSGTDRPNQ